MQNNYSFQSIYFDYPIKKGRVLDIFEPLQDVEKKESALFIVHGGGWRGGSRASFHEIMGNFAAKGFTVCSTDYRLDAKDAFEQIKDIRDGYMLFAQYLKKNNRNVKIFVYGESAGSHLASMLLYTDINKPENWIAPAAGILHATPCSFLPWPDMMDSVYRMFTSIAAADPKTNPEVYEKLSLKNYVSKDNPVTFFMEAEWEHIFFPDETLKIVHQHQKFGIKSLWKMYRGVEHGFFYTLTRSAQREALEDIALFMEGKLDIKVPTQCNRYNF
jgi:acetyl esterase/lipase